MFLALTLIRLLSRLGAETAPNAYFEGNPCLKISLGSVQQTKVGSHRNGRA
jgi:hypothetical protein